MNKNILLISGTARSGTSALTRYLNVHQKICIGMERYKKLLLKDRAFSNDLFLKERFFDFKESDTNVLPTNRPNIKQLYAELKDKYDSADYVGDKIPNIAEHIGNIFDICPNIKVLYIIRNVYDVASSWEKRAQDVEDVSWPKSFNYLTAAKKWNVHNILITQILKEGGLGRNKLLVLSYENFFSGNDLTRDRLLRFLGVQNSEKLEKKYRALSNHYIELLNTRKNSLTKSQKKEIGECVDFKVYRKLVEYQNFDSC